MLSYAEVKALCAGDDRIKEKMDLEVEVAKLRLLKSEYQSTQYQLEDRLLKRYPEQIKKKEAQIAGIKADQKTAEQHPKSVPPVPVPGKTRISKNKANTHIIVRKECVR